MITTFFSLQVPIKHFLKSFSPFFYILYKVCDQKVDQEIGFQRKFIQPTKIFQTIVEASKKRNMVQSFKLQNNQG